MNILSVREPTPPSVAQTAGSSGPTAHKFTVEYHLNSRRASETLDEHSGKCRFFTRTPQAKAEPWRPFFQTCEDFVFSEVLMEIGTSRDQFDRLLKVIRTCIDGKGSLSLSNYSDMMGAWECALAQLTPVSPQTVSEFVHDHFILKSY
jgi:hypothetical protein